MRFVEHEHLKIHIFFSMIDRLTFYFGTTDEWCPLEYYENLKRLVPETKAYVCNYGIQHAFVLQSSRLMANLVSQWILSS